MIFSFFFFTLLQEMTVFYIIYNVKLYRKGKKREREEYLRILYPRSKK